MTDTYPALEIDPRAVERLTAYLVRTAHIRACDPTDYQRRYLAGLYVLARMRRLPSRFVKAAHPFAPVIEITSRTRRVKA